MKMETEEINKDGKDTEIKWWSMNLHWKYQINDTAHKLETLRMGTKKDKRQFSIKGEGYDWYGQWLNQQPIDNG